MLLSSAVDVCCASPTLGLLNHVPAGLHCWSHFSEIAVAGAPVFAVQVRFWVVLAECLLDDRKGLLPQLT